MRSARRRNVEPPQRWFSRSQNSEDGIRPFRPIRGRIALGLLRSQRLASTGGIYLFAQVVRYWPSYPHRQGLNRPLTVSWSPAAATPLSSHSVATPDPPPDRSKWSDSVLRIPVVRESKGTVGTGESCFAVSLPPPACFRNPFSSRVPLRNHTEAAMSTIDVPSSTML
jgi:hypothetical protein